MNKGISLISNEGGFYIPEAWKYRGRSRIDQRSTKRRIMYLHDVRKREEVRRRVAGVVSSTKLLGKL